MSDLKLERFVEFDNVNLAVSLEVVAPVHKDIWSCLRIIYETAPPPMPHKFQPGEWVFIKRYQRETLQPH